MSSTARAHEDHLLTIRTPRLRLRRSRRAIALAGAVVALAGIGLAPTATHAAGGWVGTGSLPGLGNAKIWSLAVDPQNPQEVVAGTDNGIYYTADGGTTWKQSSFQGFRVWVVGFDLRNPRNIYAGTAGEGILASTDAGATWTNQSTGLINSNVRSMAFGLSQIAAGTDSGVAVSSDGRHWGRGGLDGVSVSAITVLSNSPSLVLMAGTDTGDTSQGYIWVNSGNTWSADHGTGLPSGSNIAVSSLASGPLSQAITHRPVVVDTTQGTFRSLDGGQTWSPATNLPTVGTATLGLTVSAFSPLDPNLVYSGADAGGSPGGGMLRSIDSGVTYTDISTGIDGTHKNITAIAVAQTEPPIVYIADVPAAGGARIYRVTDTAAPTPPKLVPESPGSTIPTAVGTPTPTPKPKTTATATPKPNPGSSLLGTVFHWPVPLVYELIVLLLGAYAYIWWRQRRYIEGPP